MWVTKAVLAESRGLETVEKAHGEEHIIPLLLGHFFGKGALFEPSRAWDKHQLSTSCDRALVPALGQSSSPRLSSAGDAAGSLAREERERGWSQQSPRGFAGETTSHPRAG